MKEPQTDCIYLAKVYNESLHVNVLGSNKKRIYACTYFADCRKVILFSTNKCMCEVYQSRKQKRNNETPRNRNSKSSKKIS